MIKAKDLDKSHKKEILEFFFTANYDNQIKILPRYLELYNDFKNYKSKTWSSQDWLDLQVLYNLSWLGFKSKELPEAKKLINKERNYSESDKMIFFEIQKTIIEDLIPRINELQEEGKIQLSFSPFYHPILPLLVNSLNAKEAIPNIDLKKLDFHYKKDAEYQIAKSMNYYKQNFSSTQKGMWPSEGSLSNGVLKLMINENISWTASDEELLKNTLKDDYENLDKYFPYYYQSKEGSINLFFRDNKISDKIGFDYSNWDPKIAADDLLLDIHLVRNKIIKEKGEEFLDDACLSIILDGENCWEFYPNNGLDFLKNLFSRLENDPAVETVLMSEVKANSIQRNIDNIFSGSWINSNFRIWIGEEIHIKAWELLQACRDLFELKSKELSKEKYEEAYEHLMIAESSDWFWWYYSRHNAPHKREFDKIFRYRLAQVYLILGYDVPEKVSKSLWSEFDGSEESDYRASTMHRANQ